MKNKKKTKIKLYECDCEICSSMCHAPCCGTTEDMKKLIEEGYGKRLMLDDWPGDEPIIKPALKGHEGEKAPYQVATPEGCTFWKDGLCELHSLGLKPSQGKMAHHSLDDEKYNEIVEYIKESWRQDDQSFEVISMWEKINE